MKQGIKMLTISVIEADRERYNITINGFEVLDDYKNIPNAIQAGLKLYTEWELKNKGKILSQYTMPVKAEKVGA